MTTSLESSLVQALQEKLTVLEKKFSDLESKYKTISMALPGIGGSDDNVVKSNAQNNDSNNSMKTKDALEGPKTVAEKQADPSPHLRVKILIRRLDPLTGESLEEPAKSAVSTQEKEDDKAFVLKKEVFEKFGQGTDVSSEIDIKNPDLWELLKKRLEHYPYHTFRGPPVTIHSPYEALIYNWDALEEELSLTATNDKERLAREDLRLLLEVVSGPSSGDARLSKYFQNRKTYSEQGTIQFEDLWTIFAPGTLIYGRPFQNQDQLFIVQDNKMTWPRRDDKSQYLPFKLDVWTYDWTGQYFERTSYEISVDHYDGHRPITSLPYFPFDLHKDKAEIGDKLIERGQRFKQLCMAKEGERLFDYNGETIFGQKGFSGFLQDEDDESDARSRSTRNLTVYDIIMGGPPRSSTQLPTPKSQHIESRVMVDYASYFQYGPTFARNGNLPRNLDNRDCMCGDCSNNEGLSRRYRTRFDLKRYIKAKWEDEQYMLCPPRVLGYILSEKQWAQLEVNTLEDIPARDQNGAWESRLQLAGKGTKSLLLDLVRSHVSNPKKMPGNHLEVNDIIPRKGKGLVVLLYGPPGVGKTSTAETIAMATRKPLFSISVADVGTKARNVEANLAKIFALATSWQAILLIDEADVFLESRGKGMKASTEKNALVSVFLRVLEYYQGIMFLTTNQIAQFDVAIPSRIHIAIKYESLTQTQMEKIFRGFLDPLNRNGLIKDYDGIMEWLNEDIYTIKFDGRQIRNAVTTALGLARAEANDNPRKAQLTKSHLKRAVQNARAFKEEFMVQFDRYKSTQENMIQ